MPIISAHDTNLFLSGHNLDLMETKINLELKEISERLKVNKLSLNIKKTNSMIFTTKRTRFVGMSLQIDGHIFNETDSTKSLGVITDNNLSWKNHIKHVVGNVSNGIGMILNARKLVNPDALITLYYSFLFFYALCIVITFGVLHMNLSWKSFIISRSELYASFALRALNITLIHYSINWDWSNFMTSILI